MFPLFEELPHHWRCPTHSPDLFLDVSVAIYFPTDCYSSNKDTQLRISQTRHISRLRNKDFSSSFEAYYPLFLIRGAADLFPWFEHS